MRRERARNAAQSCKGKGAWQPRFQLCERGAPLLARHLFAERLHSLRVNASFSNFAGCDCCASPDYIVAVMPALNEEEGIAGTIQRLLAAGIRRVIVADNGSTDATARVAREAGAHVVAAPQLGYGAACAEALRHVPDDAQWILFVDADAGAELEDLPGLFAAAEGKDFVLGDRTFRNAAGLTPVQRFGNWLATRVLRMIYGFEYRDLGPLRLIRRTALDRIGMRDRGFGWTVEMQARALECGLRIAEIPLRPGGRAAGKSKISGTIRGSWRAGRAILATLMLVWWRGRVEKLRADRIQRTLALIAAVALCGGALCMMPYGDFKGSAQNVLFFLMAAGVMSIGFAAGLFVQKPPALLFWGVATAARVLLLPMTPGDDVWRYIWEGWIQLAGHNPYFVSRDMPVVAEFRAPWTALMNNPGSTTIYPPFALLTFAGLSALAREVLVFKLAFVAADLLVCVVLVRAFGRQQSLAYAWNPLIIYCFAGGAHYDSLFVLPMTIALCLSRGRGGAARPFSAFFSGVAAAFKWVTGPLILHDVRTALASKRWKLAATCAIAGAVPILLGCAWFSEAYLTGNFYPQSFTMHARSAELIPFYFEHPHPWWPYNTLVRGAVLVLILVVLLAFAQQREIFAERWLFAVLALSPLVHAWYFTWLAPFAVITRNLGATAAGISGFAYFILHWHIKQPGGMWQLSPVEHAVFWGPLVGGYLISLFLRIPRDEPLRVGADQTKTTY